VTKRKGPFCGAKLHQRQGTCTQPAGWGTDHVGAGACKLHGGCMPNHQAGALRVLAEGQARAELARLGVEATPVLNPLEQLARLAGEAEQWKDILRAQVAALESLTTGDGRMHGEALALERALAQCGAFCIAMARLNIDDRIVKVNQRISEAQGVMMYNVMVAVFGELGIDVTDERLRASCARQLQAVAERD